MTFLAAVEQVFKIGSMEPGAVLFDASKEFEVSNVSSFFVLLVIGRIDVYFFTIHFGQWFGFLGGGVGGGIK